MQNRTNGKLKSFSQGVALYGTTALAVTDRQGSARLPKQRRGYPPSGSGLLARFDDHQAPREPSSPSSSCPVSEEPSFGPAFEQACLERTRRLVELLDSSEVRLPQGVPGGGKVVSETNALLFVARYARMLYERGRDVAAPRVAFHWTSEANFESIASSNLRVPDGAEVKKKHGAAFGRGIYVSPDFRFAREDFSYGAAATFACLVLTGRQELRQPRSSRNAGGLGQGFDSVTGRLPGRLCDTWVLPTSEQVLPCFLTDELAAPQALAALRDAIALLCETWPQAALEVSPPPTRPFTQELALAGTADAVAAIGGDEEEDRSASCAGDGDRSSAGIGAAPALCSSGAPAAPVAPRADGGGGDAAASIAVEDFRIGSASAASEGDAAAAAAGLAPAARRWGNRRLVAEGGLADACPEAERCPASASRAAARAAAADSSAACGARRRWSSGAVPGRDIAAAAEPKAASSAVAGSRWLVTVAGDILASTETLLAHQCCCVSGRPAEGLAAAVFERFPEADVYRQRREQGRPVDQPGGVSVHGRVANLYSRFCPGAPLGGIAEARRSMYAECFARFPGVSDSGEERATWFRRALEALVGLLPEGRPRSVALPAAVDCGGGGGGSRSAYLAAVEEVATSAGVFFALYDAEAAPGAVSGATGQPSLSPEGARRAAAQALSPADGSAARSSPSMCSGLAPPSLGGAQRRSFWDDAVFEYAAAPGGDWAPFEAGAQEELAAALRRGSGFIVALADGSEVDLRGVELGQARVWLRSQSCTQAGSEDAAGGASATLAAPAPAAAATAAAASGGPAAVRLRPAPPPRSGQIRVPEELEEAPAPDLDTCGQRLRDGGAGEESAEGEAPCCAICSCGWDEGAGFGSARDRRGDDAFRLLCGHVFHEACLARWFRERWECPTCKRRFGPVVGSQPRTGSLSWRMESGSLPGHGDCGTIVVTAQFPPGVDHEGVAYGGREERAYLADDAAGHLLLALFQLAFRRRVLFGLGISMKLGVRRPTFNVHLKTSRTGGVTRHGYPDKDYEARTLEELLSNGVAVGQLA